MFPYDASLRAAVQTAPQTLPAVLAVLETIDNTCVAFDGLRWFNGLYWQVTQEVDRRVSAGGFTDPAWVAQLDVEFANLYFSALGSWLSGQACPGCWQALFTRRNQNAVARIQFALAGVNAHINHDLAKAVVATCRVTRTAPEHGGIHYVDYIAVNSTLDGLVEAAKRTLNVRLPGDELPPVTHLEDTIAAWNVSAARESAWQNAEHLWQFRALPALSASYLDMLDGLATVIGKTLLVPVP